VYAFVALNYELTKSYTRTYFIAREKLVGKKY
jgi:hypothetical protein